MAKSSKSSGKSTVKSAVKFAKPGVLKGSAKGNGPAVPKIIYATASPHSIGGTSMFDCGQSITCETVAAFTSEEALMNLAAQRLKSAGFEILQITESTINIAGAAQTYEKAFGAPIEVRTRNVIKEFGVEEEAEFLDCPNSELFGLISMRGTEFEGLLEGVAIEEPRYFMAANPFAPTKEYWHLDVPAGVSLACNADRAHRAQLTGRGVTVAMVDSGWFRHPFFTERGYRSDTAILGPGASNPTADESGHGTGESANIFAVAPDIRLKPVKINFVNSTGAFNAAVGLGPDIITCSWGSSIQTGPLSAANVTLANAIASAVASGIVVVFSAGNGHWGFPGQHPDVISAGGVYLDENNALMASDYASGFASNIYSGRNVPDLSGIVGLRPGAKNIMLPVEPGDSIDVSSAGGTHPDRDETAPDDGWAAFSGTSAAAPQLAGAVALIKQACERLTPAEIRTILMNTARDVTTGTNHPNFGISATTGPDLATGHGLVDAHRATLQARLRCRTVTPIRPIQPRQPIQPPTPIRPVQPVQPVAPVRPVRPINPIRPASPVARQDEEDRTAAEAQMAEAAQQGAALDEDELDALEDMVRKGQIDPDEI